MFLFLSKLAYRASYSRLAVRHFSGDSARVGHTAHDFRLFRGPSAERLIESARISGDGGLYVSGQLDHSHMEFAEARSMPDADERCRRLRELRVQAFLGSHIERAGGFVEKGEAPTVEQKARERKPLLFAARGRTIAYRSGEMSNSCARSRTSA
jgi:hypothetical protein